MNLIHIRSMLIGLAVVFATGCAGHTMPETSRTGVIVDVRIGDDSVMPKTVIVKPGDEVRWVNTTRELVNVEFLQPLLGLLSCKRGFKGWAAMLGSPEMELEVAKLEPNASASLCFSTIGLQGYIVRGDKTVIGQAAKASGTVRVE